MESPTRARRARAPRRPAGGGAARAAVGPARASLAEVIHRVSRSITELTLEDLRRFGMTVPRWSVLTQLAIRDGRSIGELARATVIKQSSLTRVVDQMERDGLVRRRASRGDSRIVQVWLTKDGRARYDDVVPLAVQRVNRALDGLREAEVELLGSLLDRLLSSVRASRR